MAVWHIWSKATAALATIPARLSGVDQYVHVVLHVSNYISITSSTTDVSL